VTPDEERERIERMIERHVPPVHVQLQIRAEALELAAEVEGLQGPERRRNLAQQRELLRLAVEAEQGRPVEWPRDSDVEWRAATAAATAADQTMAVIGSAPATAVPIARVFGGFAPTGVEANIHDQLGIYTEVIAPGALTRTLAERGDEAELRLQHGRHPVVGALPIGVFDLLYETRRGGWFSAEPLDASYVRELVLPAVYSALMYTSFGFRVAETPNAEVWTRRGGRPYRQLRDIDLHEVTLCTNPAYRDGTAVGWTPVATPQHAPERAAQIETETRERRDAIRRHKATAQTSKRRQVMEKVRAEQNMRRRRRTIARLEERNR
jgi:HK97 family phage prohead protease